MTGTDGLFKIITLGDTAVGKTSIIKRFTNDTFEEDNLSTVGIGFSFKEVLLKNGTKIKVKLIDTAGQEKYNSLAKSYYKNAEGVLFVFAYDNKDSFDHVEIWLDSFKKNGGKEDIPFFLVGNKIDLVEKKKVDDKSIDDLKNRINIKDFIQTSAKENKGIEDLFYKLSEKLYEYKEKHPEKKQENQQLDNYEKNVKERKEKRKKICGCKGSY